MNFVSVDRESDTFSITPEGLVFVQTADDSKEEKKVLQEALLAYPPAIQVLRLLAENKGYCTKFYLGERLGFRGERGFTSYDEELMFDWLGDADDFEKRKIKSDVEGSSDKYARQICNWLKNVGLLDAQTVKRTYADGSTNGFQGYKINGRGLHALRQAEGSSKNSKHIKFLMWEFLATNCENRDYVRTRRAYILKFLQETNRLIDLFRYHINVDYDSIVDAVARYQEGDFKNILYLFNIIKDNIIAEYKSVKVDIKQMILKKVASTGFVTSNEYEELLNWDYCKQLKSEANHIDTWIEYNRGNSLGFAWNTQEFSREEAIWKAKYILLLNY